MELINFKAIFVASFSSLIVGFIWYNPKVFGTIWMNETGMTEEKAEKISNRVEMVCFFIPGSIVAFFLLKHFLAHS